MLLQEMFQETPAKYQDLSQDNSQTRLGDMRKTKLTLAQIKKLRQMNDIRMVEYREKLKAVQRQYKPAAEPGM